VSDQGFGIINNLGALRIQELDKWGNGKLVEAFEGGKSLRVLNWDGSVSPVVHQFDRHKQLSEYWYKKKTSEYRAKWQLSKK
jgi:hypothetical protein